MHSYHNVAGMRLFRGGGDAVGASMAGLGQERERVAGNGFRPAGLPSMDRFFLAMMVSAVLLLIVASDLLVNGLGIQEPPADMAYALVAANRPIR